MQHIGVVDAVKLFCARDETRIGGVNAVDIGVYLAARSAQRIGERYRRRVRAATAERGDIVVFVDALKAGDKDDLARLELTVQPVGAYVQNSCSAVDGVGENSRLPAGERYAVEPHRVQLHRHEGNRAELPRRQQHIQLPPLRRLRYLACVFQKRVGRIPTGGQYDHRAVAVRMGIGDDAGDPPDPFGVGDRASAEFLYYQHGDPPKEKSRVKDSTP